LEMIQLILCSNSPCDEYAANFFRCLLTSRYGSQISISDTITLYSFAARSN
jgi:hypothetical protein